MSMPGTFSTNSMFPPIVDSKGKRVFNYWVLRLSEKLPEIDDVICHYLDGEMLKNALVFIDFIRTSKMKIKQNSANVWSVKCKGKHVLDIMVKQDSWGVRLVFDHIKSGSVIMPRKAEEIKSLINTINNPYYCCNEPVGCYTS